MLIRTRTRRKVGAAMMDRRRTCIEGEEEGGRGVMWPFSFPSPLLSVTGGALVDADNRRTISKRRGRQTTNGIGQNWPKNCKSSQILFLCSFAFPKGKQTVPSNCVAPWYPLFWTPMGHHRQSYVTKIDQKTAKSVKLYFYALLPFPKVNKWCLAIVWQLPWYPFF